MTYDSFGNELSYIDENGLVSQTSYDPETGEETETIHAVGTEYESKDKEYVSTDGLKTMTVDNYGRVSIDIQDAFGNTIISKDEAAGTWTESTYDYGSYPDGRMLRNLSLYRRSGSRFRKELLVCSHLRYVHVRKYPEVLISFRNL